MALIAVCQTAHAPMQYEKQKKDYSYEEIIYCDHHILHV